MQNSWSYLWVTYSRALLLYISGYNFAFGSLKNWPVCSQHKSWWLTRQRLDILSQVRGKTDTSKPGASEWMSYMLIGVRNQLILERKKRKHEVLLPTEIWSPSESGTTTLIPNSVLNKWLWNTLTTLTLLYNISLLADGPYGPSDWHVAPCFI